MSARADTCVVASAPIQQIVFGFRTRTGVIGDFVGVHSDRFAQVLRHFVQISAKVVIGQAL